jgi:Ribosomal protein L11 methyltransferase (PrmA)/Arginine methyltransferase oligomerization subdomain
MTKLTPVTVLKRVAGVRIDLESAVDVRIQVAGHSGLYLEHSLAILDVFARPISLQEAMTKLRARGVQDWIDLTGTINKLFNAGALVSLSADIIPDKDAMSFGAPTVHISMLNDRDRTETFLRAIAEEVQPGDVVVDIGTGTGVLALAAARAGAARVYAIEAGTMADAAQALFEASEQTDRLTLIRGWSTQLEIPERADVLVSEIIGRDPFEERVLQTTLDARQRFLKPEARLIPARISVFCQAVTLPADRVANVCFTPESSEKWQEWYGIDFSPLTKLVHDSASPVLRVPSHQAATWRTIAEPMLLAEVDLRSFRETRFQRMVDGEIARDGRLNGLMMFFELEVGSFTITTNPLSAAPASSWTNPVWVFQEGRNARAGDRFTLFYDYNSKGNNSEIRLVSGT